MERAGLIKLFMLVSLLMRFIQPACATEKELPGYWITSPEEQVNAPNTWIAFRRDFTLERKPEHAETILAADTKYWLWINGELVVFEGGLKCGPTPTDSYYDKVDLAPYLRKGPNAIAVLVWHFGKDGFSHINSGKSGLLFSMKAGRFKLVSDKNWFSRLHPAYSTAAGPPPNNRLPESNICFDAEKDMPGWCTLPVAQLPGFQQAKETGRPGDGPWNKLVERPIPFWKDFGVKTVPFERHPGTERDTIFASLPYNMQMTPIITLHDDAGKNLIGIATDHSRSGGDVNLRAAYITKKGYQEYESYGWLNGEKIILTVPAGVKVLSVQYRETGYDTEMAQSFHCSDEFYNRFWKKASRTLYVNMRDNYFDCPDRERAQWWGDVVLLMGECFYTASVSTHALMRKAIRELAAWQRPEGQLFSPIPGNFKGELPDQMLTSIGYYGFWNYYINTGDRKTIEEVYPAVKKYLSLWQTDETGLTVLRKGDWLWGDWGENKDIRLIMAGWHYLALKGAANMAGLLGLDADRAMFSNTMEAVKKGFNRCWNGQAYRHPDYTLETDDRAQALAVITGIADASKYPKLLKLFQTQYFASPYMEKYVMEALFVMGYANDALERTKRRFEEMVEHPDYTTLFEGWGIGEKGYGGGTTNHAWSGGAQIVLGEYLFGIKPLEAGYKTFLIEPCPATFTTATIEVSTVKGKIKTAFENKVEGFTMKVTVPARTTAIVRIPEGQTVLINNKPPHKKMLVVNEDWKKERFTAFRLLPGEYIIYRRTPM